MYSETNEIVAGMPVPVCLQDEHKSSVLGILFQLRRRMLQFIGKFGIRITHLSGTSE